MRLPIIAILALAVPAAAAPHKKPAKPTKEQKEADRLFKNGVALFDQQKFTEALAEFQRAYEIAPAPIVLYNIAACHRELSHYGDAVTFYQRFLSEGAGKVPASRLSAAKGELDGILAHTAHVTVNITPQDAQLIVDGTTLDPPIPTPLILAPGEHKLVAHVDGKQDATKVVRVASGDEPTIELAPSTAPPEKPAEPQPVRAVAVTETAPPPAAESSPRFVRVRLGAAYGTNLAQTRVTGAPELGLGVGLGSRVELGVDVVLVAYAVIPTLRVRLVGDQFSLHLIAAAPIAIETGGMSTTFVAGAGGLGLRWHVTPSIGLHLEGYASFASGGHGTTFPAFLGGDVWF
jgi:hypothetical protein